MSGLACCALLYKFDSDLRDFAFQETYMHNFAFVCLLAWMVDPLLDRICDSSVKCFTPSLSSKVYTL